MKVNIYCSVCKKKIMKVKLKVNNVFEIKNYYCNDCFLLERKSAKTQKALFILKDYDLMTRKSRFIKGGVLK